MPDTPMWGDEADERVCLVNQLEQEVARLKAENAAERRLALGKSLSQDMHIQALGEECNRLRAEVLAAKARHSDLAADLGAQLNGLRALVLDLLGPVLTREHFDRARALGVDLQKL